MILARPKLRISASSLLLCYAMILSMSNHQH